MTTPALSAPARPAAGQFWGHAHHELIYLTWALMEIALLTPLCFALMRWVHFWPPSLFMFCLLLLLLLPFNLVRLMSALDIDTEQQRRVLIVALLVTVLVAWRTLFYRPESLLDLRWLRNFVANLAEINNLLWLRDLSLFLLIAFVWWRGLRLAGKTFTIAGAGLRLRVGGLILAPLVIWFGNGRVTWSLAPFILLFFLAGLTAVALIRAEEVEQAKTGRSASLDPRWVTAVFLAALLIVLAASLLALLVAGDPALAAVSWLAPLWAALYAGGTVVINTLFYLILPLFKFIGWLVELLIAWLTPLMARLSTPTPTPTLGPLDFPLEVTRTAPTAVFGSTGPKLITLLLMIAVVLLVTLALGRLYRRAELAERESAQTSTPLERPAGDDGLGRRLLQRLGLLRNWRTAASIRRIYQQMCQAAGASGYPRAPAETPFEYLATLALAWPELTSESQLITQAYVKVRYGELPETRAELEQIQAAWKRLEATKPVETAVADPATINLARRVKSDDSYQ
ncbi:MAG: DUF4129 domain-containing protein [Anaerolineales bacterium]|nr:DUF4129 domain-containing protein [Anaerolineales bacterium]